MDQNNAAPTLFCENSLTELEDCIGRDVLWPLLTGMHEQCIELLQELDLALAADDLANVRSLAHNMKGMAASYAAIGIANIARSIEQDDLTVAESKSRTDDLKQVLVRTREWIANAA